MNAFGPHNGCAHLFTCVGIVIGGIAGVLFLLALFSALTAALVKLIRAGKIPGIYGYKLAPQTLDGIAVSPLYSSQWSNTNPLNN